MSHVLVAGATGYLGGFVAQEFKRRGHVVRALVRSRSRLGVLETSLDEVVEGQITEPATLEHVCDDIDVVFSSVGITKQKDKLTFRDVDTQGNKNLLRVAQRAGVGMFIYVSVLHTADLLRLAIVKAHEDFVDELRGSGMNYAVLRPTGYFSDMGEFLAMARRGRVYLIGRGEHRINPIHGADLAVRCVDAMQGRHQEIDVGGPEILTYRDIAELAFRTLGQQPRITCVPVAVMRMLIAIMRPFSRHQAELLDFFTTGMSRDGVGPATGTHRLQEYFESLVGDR
jgi:uncharacterized protein YbjT (DUF2867 family)